MDELAELRRQLQQAKELIEARDQRIQQANESIEARDQRIQELEETTRNSQPKTLQQYLEACHSIDLSMRVVTSPSYTTKGDTTNPAGRIFPRRIVPWDDFAARQEEIWNDLSAGHLFHSRRDFPSQTQLDFLISHIGPISSEEGLRIFERFAVEAVVETLFARATADSQLSSNLGLQGTVRFESHTNLGEATDENMGTGASSMAPKTPRARRKARGKGNRADEFLIYSTLDGMQTPALAIEYKPPHKLSVDQIVTGLGSEIWPERDVINKDGDDFASASRRLAAAVVTQLFSYMIGKGLQYGYVCTGQAFVFLHIADDPSTVYYSVCVPRVDVMDDDETRLHRTAAAQVFAFILQALRVEPPPEAWHDKAEQLGLWEVEYDDILARIPESERKRKEPTTSPYRAQRWKGFKRSPLRTRSHCREPDTGTGRPADEDEDPPSPTPNASRYVGNVAAAEKMASTKKEGKEQGQRGQNQATKPHIRNRPFCSQKCLLGLALGKPVDSKCPNAGYHGQKHISRLEFLHLIREQLAVDRGRDADCMPLYRSGSRGSLFKARLSSHGYTLVAKGMENLDYAHLQHENEIYDRLLPIQGKYIPVCLGRIDLILPYYYDCGVFTHFMFLGWAGRPIFEYAINQINTLNITDAATRIFKAIHKLRVLHRDAEPRNILYDDQSGNLMVVDFERSGYCECQQQPPPPPPPRFSPVSQKDRQGRKKHRELQKQKQLERGMPARQGIARKAGKREISEDDFVAELKWAVHEVSHCVANLAKKAIEGNG
ncbi:hypothetical protein V8C37DRAFT_386986 [Trichoderma ceciliae]